MAKKVRAKGERKPLPTVFILDDDGAVRKRVLSLCKSIKVKTQDFPSAQAFLDAYDPTQPGCLVLDVRMPGISGLDLLTRLVEQGDKIPVVMITGYADVSIAVQAMKLGAVDFIEKPFRDQVLLEAVNRALTLDAENRKVQARRDAIAEKLSLLSRREIQVLELIVQGCTSQAIAEQLKLSVKTIEFHRGHVMNKTGAKSLAQLVQWAIEFEMV